MRRKSLKINRDSLITFGIVAILFFSVCVKFANAAGTTVALPQQINGILISADANGVAHATGLTPNGNPVSMNKSFSDIVNAFHNGFQAPAAPAAANTSAPVAEAVSKVPISIEPPAGSIPSPASVTAAESLGGAIPRAASISATAPLAAAEVAGMAKTALGVATGVGAFLGSPVLMGSLMIASVGMQGYDFYKGLKGGGIAFDAAGGATFTPLAMPSPIAWTPVYQVTPSCVSSSFSTAMNCFAATYPPSWKFSCSGSPPLATCTGVDAMGMPYKTTQGANVLQSCPVNYNLRSPGAWADCVYAGAPSVPSPATNAQVSSAVDTAVASAALDAASWAYANKAPLPNGIQFASPAASAKVASDWRVASSSVDSTGNKTETLSRNIGSISSFSPTSEPTLDVNKQTVTVVNGVPVNSTSTAVQTAPITNPGGSSNSQSQADLCAMHPDILACSNDANVGDVASQVLGNRDVTLSITPVVMPSALACPAPITFVNTFGVIETWDIFGKVCLSVVIFRPLILAFAWLTAAFIIFTGRPLIE